MQMHICMYIYISTLSVMHCFLDAGLVKPRAKPKMMIEIAATNTDIKALWAYSSIHHTSIGFTEGLAYRFRVTLLAFSA